MIRPLWEFIKDVDVVTGTLPVVHSTDLYRFQNIQDCGQLAVRPCDVYVGQSLLYFFYKRPSYRPHLTEGPLSIQSFAPVCLIFSHKLSSQTIRIMPFDSGAFEKKREQLPIHPDMKKELFELALNANAPMKLIRAFYGSEERYMDDDPLPSIGGFSSFYDFAVDSYYHIVHMRDNREVDERISTIELQLDKSVTLHGLIQGVILPAGYLDRPGICEQIEGWGAVAIPYPTGGRNRPVELHGVVVNELRKFLESEQINAR